MPQKQAPPGRPLPAGSTLLTPGASPLRREVERRSAPILILLHRLPRPLVGVLPLLLLLLGSFLPVAAALVCLALALVLLTWLAYLSWPAASTGQRALRAFVPLAVVLVAVLRLRGR